MTAPNVWYIRREVVDLLPQYQLIRDALAGEAKVKQKKDKYLPIPNSHNKNDSKVMARYLNYLARAVFYNVTRRTLAGLVGQVFMRDPQTNFPESEQFTAMVANVTGDGVTLDQLAAKAEGYGLAFSRGGLLTDYPTSESGFSVEQIRNGEAHPTIQLFSPFEIINWRFKQVGAKTVLSLVVLVERRTYGDDGFEMKQSCMFRVLRLNDAGNYIQELYYEDIPTDWNGEVMPKQGNYLLKETFMPTGADSQPLKAIPFEFFGSQNNDANPDNPNFYDLASLNMAHYRNSADYEEACFITGQPTPVVVGLDENWYKNVMGGEINFGSNGGVPLPKEADFKLVQAEERTMLKEAMETKEKQMVALGAKLVEQRDTQRTATEAGYDQAASDSVLVATTKNVSAALTAALKNACIFTGDNPDDVEYILSTDFTLATMAADELNAVMQTWQKGGISFTEMRGRLRRGGLATQDDDEAKAEIDDQLAEQAARMAEQMETEAKINGKAKPAPVGK